MTTPEPTADNEGSDSSEFLHKQASAQPPTTTGEENDHENTAILDALIGPEFPVPDPPTDHRDYAFSNKGVAYDHRVPSAWHGVRLSTRSRKGTSLTTADPAPMVIPSTMETTEYDLDVPRGVWVGMCLPAEDSFLKEVAFDRAYPEKGDGTRSKSQSIADHDTPLIVPFDESKAYRVICFESGSTAKYYALTKQTKGLCETRSVSHDVVFFFPEFRDPGDRLTSVTARISTWNSRVRQAAKPKVERSIGDVEIRTKLPFQMDITNIARLAVSLYSTTYDTKWLEQLQQGLQNHVLSTTGKAALSNSMILRLLDPYPTRPFTFEDADFVRAEIEEKWEDFASPAISGPEVMAMRKAIVASRVTTDHRHTRMFLVALLADIRKYVHVEGSGSVFAIDNNLLGKFARGSQELVRRQLGDTNPPAPRPDIRDARGFIYGLQDYLSHLLSSIHQRNADRLALYGSSLPVSSLDEILDCVRAAPDETSLRLMLKQAIRYEIGQTMLGDDVVAKEVKVLVDMIADYLAALQD